jgi:hypothetical protein
MMTQIIWFMFWLGDCYWKRWFYIDSIIVYFYLSLKKIRSRLWASSLRTKFERGVVNMIQNQYDIVIEWNMKPQSFTLSVSIWTHLSSTSLLMPLSWPILSIISNPQILGHFQGIHLWNSILFEKSRISLITTISYDHNLLILIFSCNQELGVSKYKDIISIILSTHNINRGSYKWWYQENWSLILTLR